VPRADTERRIAEPPGPTRATAGAAGFQHVEEPYRRVRRALGPHRDLDLGADAQPAEVPRELLGAVAELAAGRNRVLKFTHFSMPDHHILNTP